MRPLRSSLAKKRATSAANKSTPCGNNFIESDPSSACRAPQRPDRTLLSERARTPIRRAGRHVRQPKQVRHSQRGPAPRVGFAFEHGEAGDALGGVDVPGEEGEGGGERPGVLENAGEARLVAGVL